MAPPVHTERDGDVLVVTLDNPPVNALGHAVRAGLMAALDAAEGDAQVTAIVLCGAGKVFSGGADIREFGVTREPPLLFEVCDRIGSFAKPVVACLHGAALGGGLEVALAAHHRVASPAGVFALPEVQLGLLPGAGGTQRAPRLIGAAVALDLMLSGRRMKAAEALQCGLIDSIVDDARAGAITAARRIVAAGGAPRRTRDAAGLADHAASRAAIDAARAEESSPKRKGLFSPQKIVDAVAAALDTPFEAGLATERAAFRQCLESPQHRALTHLFFAERAVANAPTDAAPRAIAKVGIVGGGTMGAGIAVAALDAGVQVTMIERDAEGVARGRAAVDKVYAGLIAKGRLDAAQRDKVLARFQASADHAALADADVVIEAAFEDMAVKRTVFAALDCVCRPGAVLATNTSYLDIDAIAAATRRPQDVIGLHFFSPANVMKLLEIVVPAKAAPEVVATAFALAKAMKKVPVRAGVCDGFIGNRMLSVYRRAAEYMVEDGASPYDIDAALREFGYPMGPFQVSDLAGGDIGWATRKRKAPTRDARERYVQIADRLCERGWFGQKTGRGWYHYPQGARAGVADPEVLDIVAAERARVQVTPRPFDAEMIVRRYLAAMVNEGANVVHEGIALRPLDIDVVLVNGYGFPRHRGGPMHHADQIGLPQVLADLREFALEDRFHWRPSPLLVELAESGRSFASLNHR